MEVHSAPDRLLYAEEIVIPWSYTLPTGKWLAALSHLFCVSRRDAGPLGFGLFADKDFPAGAYVSPYFGTLFNPREAPNSDKLVAMMNGT
jgi:hypothetical protein